FEAKHRERVREFRIRPEPSPDDLELYAVTHIEPPGDRSQALGYNPATEPTRFHAMETAAQTGKASVTDRLVLKADEALGLKRGAIVLYAPTYYSGAELLPQNERAHLVHGFVGAGFYLDDFVSHLRRGPSARQIGFQILSGLGESEGRLVAQTGVEEQPEQHYRQTRTLSVPGGSWTITYWTLPEFHESSSYYQVPMVALTGLVLSLALYSLAVVQAKARRAQELALYHEIERARDLEEQDKAKTRFFSNLNHELRTPLNGILGMSDLLYDTNLDEQQKEYLESIGSCGKALMELIGDVLDLSKINAGKMDLNLAPHSIKELFSQALEVVRGPAQGKGVELVLDWDDNIPLKVSLDGQRLRQVLINLLGNAVKFTEKGQVTLRVTAAQDNDLLQLCFEVQDTGIGIAREDVKRLFRPFSQLNNELTTNDQKGTGLGLHLCRELLNMMDGSIEVQSTLGVGTTFRCWLPVEPAEPDGYETQTIPDAESQLRKPLRILVVDDNPINRRVLGLQLEKMGHEAALATGGREAVSTVDEVEFDLVLMDCQMPDMDGLEATRKIREKHSNALSIVALTAFSEETQRAACLEAGMDDFLTKPIEASMLKNILDKYSQMAARAAIDSDQ
ncbi:MAG: response regulator, partial [Candidatus Eremiobacteraeota bacterium]|nr:response regulator [Candidatus Eremiobacteraeota bacterium]